MSNSPNCPYMESHPLGDDDSYDHCKTGGQNSEHLCLLMGGIANCDYYNRLKKTYDALYENLTEAINSSGSTENGWDDDIQWSKVAQFLAEALVEEPK